MYGDVLSYPLEDAGFAMRAKLGRAGTLCALPVPSDVEGRAPFVSPSFAMRGASDVTRLAAAHACTNRHNTFLYCPSNEKEGAAMTRAMRGFRGVVGCLTLLTTTAMVFGDWP